MDSKNKFLIIVVVLVSIVLLSNFSLTEITGNAIGDWNHCSDSNKCSVGEGDCDRDSHCATGFCYRDEFAENRKVAGTERNERKAYLQSNYGFRRGVDVCESLTFSPPVEIQYVLDNNVQGIKSLEKPISNLAVDQLLLNHKKLKYCDSGECITCQEGTENCQEKILFFSCLEETNKEQCENSLLQEVGISTTEEIGSVIIQYIDALTNPIITTQQTLPHPDWYRTCEVSINYQYSVVNNNARAISQSFPGTMWSYLQPLSSMESQLSIITDENPSGVSADCPHSNPYPQSCYLLDIQNTLGSLICKDNYWELCTNERTININGNIYECRSGEWRIPAPNPFN